MPYPQTLIRVLACAGLLSAALAAPVAAAAANATFPNGQPIRLIVGFTPGGGVDTQARAIAQGLSEKLGNPVIVENRPGASTILATTTVMRAAPDGNTLLYTPSSSMAQNPHTLLQATYDPFKDFTPISLAARGPLALLVNSEVPAKDVQELIAYLKSRPGQASYASFGTGTSSHIVGERFARQNGLDVQHIAYKGGSDAARDLLAGRIEYMLDAAPSGITSVSTGKARMLAITAPKRSAYLPDVPTFAEAGVTGLDLPSWVGIYGPAGMAPDTVARLNTAIGEVLRSEPVTRVFAMGAYEVEPSTAEDFARITRESYDTWGAVVADTGIDKQ